VRVLRHENEMNTLQAGEILVAAITAPSWASAFSVVSGVITDIGGMMSHAAIVCREYGMPAVVSTGFATSRLKTGQRVRVDGDKGTVTCSRVGSDVDVNSHLRTPQVSRPKAGWWQGLRSSGHDPGEYTGRTGICCLDRGVYRDYLAATGLRQRLDFALAAIDRASIESMNKAAESIEVWFTDTPLPSDLRAGVAEGYQSLCDAVQVPGFQLSCAPVQQ